MKSIDFYIYYFTHKIDLREYFEKVYSMSFNQVNNQFQSASDPDFYIDPQKNTWIRKGVPKDKKSPKGVFLGAGNILDWEAIENDTIPAETTPLILKNIKGLSNYSSIKFKRIQRLYGLINIMIYHNSDPDVEDYLNNRGIDIQLIKNDFSLGILSNYDRIYNNIPSKKRNNLLDVFISREKVYRCLKPDKGFAVPIKYNSLGQVGYHGRYIADIKKPYFNSGYVRDIKSEILFGEDNPKIQIAIKTKRQLLLCKEIIDLFAAYQGGFQQVLSILYESVSVKQFRAIKKYDVNEIIIGYHVDNYQARFAALMKIYKLKTPVKIISDGPDIDEKLLDPGISAENIIKKAMTQSLIEKADKRKARVDLREYIMSELKERGRTFLVKTKDIQKHIESKSTPKQLRRFLKEECRKNTKLLSEGTGFVEFPNIWGMKYLDTFGAELKTLLYLLIKCPKYGKIGITTDRLMNALGIKESALGNHKKKLIEKRYLIVERHLTGKGKTRKEHMDYYPSTLPFARLDDEK